MPNDKMIRQSAFKPGNPGGPGRPRLTVEQRLARRAEWRALRQTSAELKSGLEAVIPWMPAIIVRMARLALDGDEEHLDRFGSKIVDIAAKLADLEVERIRALNPGPGAAVQVNFPSLSEIDRRIAELRGLPAAQAQGVLPAQAPFYGANFAGEAAPESPNDPPKDG